MMNSRKQQGSALVIALVTLTVLLLVASAMMSTSGAGRLASVNTALRGGAMSSADYALSGAQVAVNALGNPDNTPAGGWYSPTFMASDSSGMPTPLNWDAIAAVDDGIFETKVFVDRMCNAPIPVTNPDAQCQMEYKQLQGSNKIGAPQFNALPLVFYRITIRVRGPRDTLLYTQSLISR